jgi:hypothetical protein
MRDCGAERIGIKGAFSYQVVRQSAQKSGLQASRVRAVIRKYNGYRRGVQDAEIYSIGLFCGGDVLFF